MPLAGTISPTQSDVQAAMRAFLGDIMPVGVQVVTAQSNQVPEPPGSFVMMTPTRFERLETNVVLAQDVEFTGSIAGTTLTVTAVELGPIRIGAPIYGAGITDPTHIVAQVSGPPGGTGTYTVDSNQTVGPVVMAAGVTTITMNSMATMQLDFHSPDTTSGDMAQTFATVFRDAYAVDFFAGVNPAIVPLYTEDPAQRPFINDQKQYEWRWVAEAKLQVNQTVLVPQQFANPVQLDLISVDATYPP